MKIKKIWMVFLANCISLTGIAGDNIRSITVESYTHTGMKYPPVFFVTNVENNDFKNSIEKYSAFEAIDEEAIGLPIGIRVLKGHKQKVDGASFSTMMLSAGTLGLTPIINNKEFQVRYDVYVQGDSIFTANYTLDVTDVSSLYSNQAAPRELKPAEEQFLERSIAQFLHDLEAENSVKKVFNEYFYYFGSDEKNRAFSH